MNLLTSSSSSSATYSAALQNQQLQALIALTSLTGTPDLNNVVNSSYLSAAVAAMIGSSTSVSNKGQKKQDIQSNSLTGQKKTHKVDDATATNIPK
ncbi:hypothetical protein Mgra_00009049 [Meloidogyne graminicola]|uniref:Uncharacterized protein n=1 Tax=Meloidogyne graminicola TaxID=189291 RepID=A0A8S9ZDZ4_9BILA|nr:hypothetical protein Mgra_00009049 [Meloidogyne graminicola]